MLGYEPLICHVVRGDEPQKRVPKQIWVVPIVEPKLKLI